MSTPFDKRQASVIRKGLTSVLTPADFRKHGCVYKKDLPDISWIIEVQKDRFASEIEADLTIYAGVFVPHVISTYMRSLEPLVPKTEDCCISQDIGSLSPDGRYVVWRFRADDMLPLVDDAIIRDINARVQRDVLPFLGRFQSLSDVIGYLNSPRPPGEERVWPNVNNGNVYLGLIYYLKGDLETSRRYLETAATAVKDGSLYPVLIDLQKRLLN